MNNWKIIIYKINKMLVVLFAFIFYLIIGLIVALAVGICEFIGYYIECFKLWWITYIKGR